MTIRIHPRVPENSPGDFYVEAGLCWFCQLAPSEASSLMHIPKDGSESCYFKRQPETADELNAAIQAVCVSEMCAVRYGGTDETILRRLWERGQAHQCDHALAEPPSTEVAQRESWWTQIKDAKHGDSPPNAMRKWMEDIHKQSAQRNSYPTQRPPTYQTPAD